MSNFREASKQATLLASTGRTEQAVSTLRSALQEAIALRDANAIEYLCAQLCVLDDRVSGPAAVANWASIALEWLPKSARFYYVLADAYWRLGKEQLAIAAASRAWHLKDLDPDTRELLASHPALSLPPYADRTDQG